MDAGSNGITARGRCKPELYFDTFTVMPKYIA